ncbi:MULTISPECIES: DUF2213 domain-containing protein [unclassified Aureimonas]|uniref:DUF2213 domain-containing protein n=1 Tax=unclassified Aureimonas TaxID=2615206 RepID=UPI000700E3D9|nr:MULTISPECIES: DUF2213 domain-containing protein [unclassified Aureimonas]KQT52210.1 hypothetical protein ASG62_16260 [Aureimonas sp. Leaf427]KQT70556.1 hypothetical protein ASG54_21690 [Aureimonas sp. Leaf460]
MKFTDAAPIADTRRTADGYLVADARIVRTGIQAYTGAEVGKPDLAIVRVYRPEAEVFDAKSLASFSHVPITNDHPTVAVTADNWKDLAVGETSGEVLRDGHRLRIPLIVKDASAIASIEGGKRELSAGYTCDLAFESGKTADGESYDAIQKNIRANHVAIVARGRAGAECRIGDAAGGPWGAAPINDANHSQEGRMADALRKVMVDGLQVETTDAGAAAIEKITKDKQAVETRLSDAEKAHVTALAAKDAELAKKDAAIDDLKGKVLSDADLDKRVQDRALLVTVAGMIAKDVKTAGLSDAAIKKAVVVAKLGDAAVAGKSDAYFDARFDILAEDAAKADPLRDALLGQPQPVTDAAVPEAAWKAMVADMQAASRPSKAA